MRLLHSSNIRNPRKTQVLFLLLSVIVLLSACTDPFSYRSSKISPHDYIGSEWQSEEPFFHLQVLENREMNGYLLINGVKIDVVCSIEWGHSVRIHKVPQNDTVYDSDYIMEGTCECTEQEVVINVEKDYFFNGQYPIIVLNRVE